MTTWRPGPTGRADAGPDGRRARPAGTPGRRGMAARRSAAVQSRPAARSRASVVLPTPAGPTSRMAWGAGPGSSWPPRQARPAPPGPGAVRGDGRLGGLGELAPLRVVSRFGAACRGPSPSPSAKRRRRRLARAHAASERALAARTPYPSPGLGRPVAPVSGPSGSGPPLWVRRHRAFASAGGIDARFGGGRLREPGSRFDPALAASSGAAAGLARPLSRLAATSDGADWVGRGPIR